MTIAYADRVAGIERFVEIAPEATRGAVRGSARGAPLPFEQPFLDGSDDEVFPRFRYLQEARSWLFAISSPPRRGVPPAAMMVRGYLLGPVDEPLPLADGRPVVDLQPPDELADLLAGAEFLDEHDGRFVADGSGDWFQLHRVDADHALLVGWDAEDTETFFGAAVSYFSASEETDLLAGAPSGGPTSYGRDMPARSRPTPGSTRSTFCAGGMADSGPRRSVRPTLGSCTNSSNPTRTTESSAGGHAGGRDPPETDPCVDPGHVVVLRGTEHRGRSPI